MDMDVITNVRRAAPSAISTQKENLVLLVATMTTTAQVFCNMLLWQKVATSSLLVTRSMAFHW